MYLSSNYNSKYPLDPSSFNIKLQAHAVAVRCYIRGKYFSNALTHFYAVLVIFLSNLMITLVDIELNNMPLNDFYTFHKIDFLI